MLSVWPGEISTLYLVVVKLRMICGRPCALSAVDQRFPPMKLRPTGSASSLVMERSAWVGWPLTSLIPKISELGNDVEIFKARPGGGGGSSTSSSAWEEVSVMH